jgi:hypothetical protein
MTDPDPRAEFIALRDSSRKEIERLDALVKEQTKKIESLNDVPEPEKTPDIDELKKQIRKEVEQENKEKQDKQEKERLLETVFRNEEDKEELSLKELQLLAKDRNKDTGGVPFIETKNPEKRKRKKAGRFEYDSFGNPVVHDE